MIITFISDTHNKHNQITKDLPGGDLLLHSGDISSRGYSGEIESFCKWFNSLDNYKHKVFIAGNHDFGFKDNKERVKEILSKYNNITYLEDNMYIADDENYPEGIKIWGSPWQPHFHNWAFNLPRNGDEIKSKWNLIPNDTDIILTHGPAWGHLDQVYGIDEHLGCEALTEKIDLIKPKIHLCGHIHSGYGYKYNENTHFFNASVLDERYEYNNKIMTIVWDKKSNDVYFL